MMGDVRMPSNDDDEGAKELAKSKFDAVRRHATARRPVGGDDCRLDFLSSFDGSIFMAMVQ